MGSPALFCPPRPRLSILPVVPCGVVFFRACSCLPFLQPAANIPALPPSISPNSRMPLDSQLPLARRGSWSGHPCIWGPGSRRLNSSTKMCCGCCLRRLLAPWLREEGFRPEHLWMLPDFGCAILIHQLVAMFLSGIPQIKPGVSSAAGRGPPQGWPG